MQNTENARQKEPEVHDVIQCQLTSGCIVVEFWKQYHLYEQKYFLCRERTGNFVTVLEQCRQNEVNWGWFRSSRNVVEFSGNFHKNVILLRAGRV